MNKKNHEFSVVIPDSLFERLKNFADSIGSPMGSLVKISLNEYLLKFEREAEHGT